MPLAGPLRAWIAKCKAYAAQHGCSYKDAMSALGGKGRKSHRRKSHRGGSGVADSAAEYNGGDSVVEGAANMAVDGSHPAPQQQQQQQHTPSQTGGGMASAFEVGAMTGMSGGRRRKRRGGSKRRGSKRRGSKRRGSKCRRSKRGGALSYSDF